MTLTKNDQPVTKRKYNLIETSKGMTFIMHFITNLSLNDRLLNE